MYFWHSTPFFIVLQKIMDPKIWIFNKKKECFTLFGKDKFDIQCDIIVYEAFQRNSGGNKTEYIPHLSEKKF